jgi:hypothetical protein
VVHGLFSNPRTLALVPAETHQASPDLSPRGWAEYDIEDFATAMDAMEKQRGDFAAIRRKMVAD